MLHRWVSRDLRLRYPVTIYLYWSRKIVGKSFQMWFIFNHIWKAGFVVLQFAFFEIWINFISFQLYDDGVPNRETSDNQTKTNELIWQFNIRINLILCNQYKMYFYAKFRRSMKVVLIKSSTDRSVSTLGIIRRYTGSSQLVFNLVSPNYSW